MSSRGKVKKSFVPCTCMIRSLLAILIDPSFFNKSNIKLTKNVEFASTFKIVFYFFNLSSSIFGWFGLLVVTRSLTPSESGLASSLESSFTSKKKLMLEQFLKGMFIAPLEGIFIILNPVF